MRVTILRDREPQQVHRTGCADLTKTKEPQVSVEVESKTDVAMVVWGDLVEEGSMSVDEAISYCSFKPCTKGLQRG